MSLNNKQETCACCKAYLFPEDDVVYCPVCGAPHHRDCYNSLNHCALEELHGTDKQYIRETETQEDNSEEIETNETVKCNFCGETFEKSNKKCPKCGAPNISSGGFAVFDILGGVPADSDLGDGVTAEEAGRFVAANTHRYLPKFSILNKNNKASWNWMAFFFPAEWMLCRKIYRGGIIAVALCIVATMMSYPLNLAIYNMGYTQSGFSPSVIFDIINGLSGVNIWILIFAAVGFLLDIGIRIVSAVFGDYFYKNYAVSTIKKIKEESEDIDADYRKKGGVNIFLFLLGFIILEYVPTIIGALM